MKKLYQNMCGIVGVQVFHGSQSKELESIQQATSMLSKRGPDNIDCFTHDSTALGHARLSIIDTSSKANQPFSDPTGRYTIVFNGEIYNYNTLKKELESKRVSFLTSSDTEVLLHLFIQEGKKCLQKLNGFFSFCVHDKETNNLFLARDRMGIKPLVYYHSDQKFAFASEHKALMEFAIDRKLNYDALLNYLQLNYVPAPLSMFQGVKKLLPGHCMSIENGKITIEQYYQITPQENKIITYQEAQKELRKRLEESVAFRMVADVPLGSFLSGGIDSSIIATLAAKETDKLHTFSIGFKNEPFFDETAYAELVAKKIRSEHTVFSLSNNELHESLHELLEYLDEPFADSSAILVNILSERTKKYVTVALSGDGADEIFSGYHKHRAEFKARQKSLTNSIIENTRWIWRNLPQSRNSKLTNLFRQLDKFSEGLNLNRQERYWKWASFNTEQKAKAYISDVEQHSSEEYDKTRNHYLNKISKDSITSILLTDSELVLPNDMLTKVDLMSMANSLEVRTPFLDHNVVNFAFSLPDDFKINDVLKKRILQDTFRKDLPQQLYNRPKKGFEVPLLKWLQTDLKDMIEKLLEKDFIQNQGIFNYTAIKELKTRLFSSNPGDAHATIWALIVFQQWWTKYFQ